MRACPTSNMNRSRLWGFEVSHIITAFALLTASNIVLNVLKYPLILSWLIGASALIVLRVLSLGQKEGHLELLLQFTIFPHLYLGHRPRSLDV
jgi:hypothetical protein